MAINKNLTYVGCNSKMHVFIKSKLKNKKGQKSVFWEALILAIFIFAVGLFLGYMLEKNRTSRIISIYQQSELDLLDIQIQENSLNLNNLDCDAANKQLIDFANRIYEESRLLDRYETASELGTEILQQHKKYDLLRAILWTNSLLVAEKCNNSPKRVVYIYEFDSENIETNSMQAVFSKKLLEVKNEYGSQIILIPLAGNLNVSSVSYLRKIYGVDSLPTVLIDEKIKIQNLSDLRNIDAYFK